MSSEDNKGWFVFSIFWGLFLMVVSAMSIVWTIRDLQGG